ncbi:hypothetical protein QEP66_14230 [Streptomyces sp. LB8]|uniref:hypothetical protein n=1 Tax=Streptomyces sp. LB8 TaxID=3042509 RepID=UPI0026499A3E|nr:hypothetical protein [Streptomyces sp. LB8]MDN5383230.1 hypothetical protein [Streptomyces sp. LB8]
MGDYIQTVVDLDATPAEAPALAERALDRLVREGIVRAGRTDCVLGAPLGNPPEEHWAKAVAEPDREPADGLDAEIGRTVFHGGQGGAHYAVCPQYDERTCFCTGTWKEIEGADEPFFAAIRTWDATGEATVTCPHCASASDLRAWKWADDYYAFAHLGLECWNWPDFAPRFLDDFAQVLGGHRAVRIRGKL